MKSILKRSHRQKRSVKTKRLAFISPPPPPSVATVREWFVGIVLSNPELMRSISEKDRIAESIRIADEMVRALGEAKLPTPDTLNVSKIDLEKMSRQLTKERELSQRHSKETISVRNPVVSSILPPPMTKNTKKD